MVAVEIVYCNTLNNGRLAAALGRMTTNLPGAGSRQRVAMGRGPRADASTNRLPCVCLSIHTKDILLSRCEPVDV